MGITDGKILFRCGISEAIEVITFSTRYYNNRIFYDCFNNPFPDHGGIPGFNIPLINIDDSTRPYKNACIPLI